MKGLSKLEMHLAVNKFRKIKEKSKNLSLENIQKKRKGKKIVKRISKIDILFKFNN